VATGRAVAGSLVVSLVATICAIGVFVPGAEIASAVPIPVACKNPPSASGVVSQQPWNQAWFDAPEKIWPFSTGGGTTVAVIDTGVDASHPQLLGKVLPGYDFVRNVAQGDIDCVPHGTAEAGVIAATRLPGVGSYGLAPNAKILPLRVSEHEVVDDKSQPVDTRNLAAAITYAADHGADVIDCAVVSYRDDPGVAAAVRHALDRGVVVVAMAGDAHNEDRDGIGPTQVPPPEPASYPGVIGVGAIDNDGRRVSTSQIGDYVDLVAPGSQVLAPATVGQNQFDGTSIASAFVAATAALVLAERPSLIGSASGRARVTAVTKRLLATGGPELSAQESLAYGAGVVDPYRALTEADSNRAPAPLGAYNPPPPPQPDPVKEAAARLSRHTGSQALRLALILGAAVVLLLALAVLVPRGRTLRWRAMRASHIADSPADDQPEYVASEALFRPPMRSGN
jgi:type VII secretion-associated serine protease mycosin